MTPILQQHARRVLDCSNKSSLFRSYATLWSSEAKHSWQSRIKGDVDQKQQTIPVFIQGLQHEGNQVRPSDMRGLINNPCGSNLFSQALEASKWLGIEKVSTHFVEDYAARLHLAKTSLGLEEAEKFFKSSPGNMRDYSVYSPLLTSYTRSEETPDKAEFTFEKKAKAREEGYVIGISSLSKLDVDVQGEEEGDDVRELDSKKSMMLLHVLNLVLLLLTLSLPFLVVPSNLIVPMVVLSLILTHISITLRCLFF